MRLREFIKVWGEKIDEMPFDDFWDLFLMENKDKMVKMVNGSCRGCFVFKDVDWVLKFNIKPAADEDMEEYGYLWKDNCSMECERYTDVCNYYEGAAPVFLPIEEFAWVGEMTFYVQRKVDKGLFEVDESYAAAQVREIGARCFKDETAADNFMDYFTNLDSITGDFVGDKQEYWLMRVLECYGVSAVDDLVRYIEDSELNDLHSGNLGFFEGRPVILDYAGI